MYLGDFFISILIHITESVNNLITRDSTSISNSFVNPLSKNKRFINAGSVRPPYVWDIGCNYCGCSWTGSPLIRNVWSSDFLNPRFSKKYPGQCLRPIVNFLNKNLHSRANRENTYEKQSQMPSCHYVWSVWVVLDHSPKECLI